MVIIRFCSVAYIQVVGANCVYDTLKKNFTFHRYHTQKVENVVKEGPREMFETKADYTMIDEPGQTFEDAVWSVLWFLEFTTLDTALLGW